MIYSDTLPAITAERITLRWLTECDIPALFNIFSNPEVMKYWSSPPLVNIEAAEALVNEIHNLFRAKTLFQWGVARCKDDTIIGTCTLSHLDIDNRRAEVGYALGSEYWGFGYMQEALGAMIGFAFSILNLHRLEADVDPHNTASIQLLERHGFMKEGYLRERWLVGGATQDALFYGLLKSEWKNKSTSSNTLSD